MNFSKSSFLVGALTATMVLGVGVASASDYMRIPVEHLLFQIDGKNVSGVNLINFDHNIYAPISSLSSLTGGNAYWQKLLPGVNLANVPKAFTKDKINMDGNSISQYPVQLNGQWYIPAQALKDQYHIPFNWNNRTNTLDIGTGLQGVPLTDLMKPYNAKGFNGNDEGANSGSPFWPLINPNNKNSLVMGGKKYTYGVQFNAGGLNPYTSNDGIDESVYFNLNGQYSQLNGLVGIDDNSATVNNLPYEILGDGSVLQKGTLSTGNLPEKFHISVSGVRQLELLVIYSSVAPLGPNSNTPSQLVDFANLSVQ